MAFVALILILTLGAWVLAGMAIYRLIANII